MAIRVKIFIFILSALLPTRKRLMLSCFGLLACPWLGSMKISIYHQCINRIVSEEFRGNLDPSIITFIISFTFLAKLTIFLLANLYGLSVCWYIGPWSHWSFGPSVRLTFKMDNQLRLWMAKWNQIFPTIKFDVKSNHMEATRATRATRAKTETSNLSLNPNRNPNPNPKLNLNPNPNPNLNPNLNINLHSNQKRNRNSNLNPDSNPDSNPHSNPNPNLNPNCSAVTFSSPFLRSRSMAFLSKR